MTRSELLDDEEYEDILDDTREEVAKYGPLKQVSAAQDSGEPGQDGHGRSAPLRPRV